MGNKTIGDLNSASNLQLTDLLEIESTGPSSKHITGQQIVDLVNDNLEAPPLQEVMDNGSTASINTLVDITTSHNRLTLSCSQGSID